MNLNNKKTQINFNGRLFDSLKECSCGVSIYSNVSIIIIRNISKLS